MLNRRDRGRAIANSLVAATCGRKTNRPRGVAVGCGRQVLDGIPYAFDLNGSQRVPSNYA
jgi:hypothetical protein